MKPIIAIDPDNNEYVVINISKFCKENNLNKGNVYKCLNKQRKHHKNWKFKRL